MTTKIRDKQIDILRFLGWQIDLHGEFPEFTCDAKNSTTGEIVSSTAALKDAAIGTVYCSIMFREEVDNDLRQLVCDS